MSETTALDGETPSQLQARLRREKRQKKMAEQGGDRLAKIKALNGGAAPPEEILGGPTVSSKSVTVEDPDEVDIETIPRTNFQTSNPRSATPADDSFTAAIRQLQQQQAQQQGRGEDNEEDPMARMMQQLTSMMGGNPNNPNDPNQPPELPAMLQAMLNGGGKTAATPEPQSAYLWRITHAIFAFTLAVYVATTSTFNGTKLARMEGALVNNVDAGLGPRLFWIFATAQVLLQSTRFFLEKGELRGTGILAKIANSGFLPPPYDQYIRTLGRYVSIFQTIVADVMVIVFTLGVLAWWRGSGLARS